MTHSSYDVIAKEYYDPRHVTSRNFDAATLNYCSKAKFLVPDSGLVLELGAGRGNAGMYCGIEHTRVIQSDISRMMLTLSPREKCNSLAQLDALKLPFVNSSFSAILAFLFDPYNYPSFYQGISRLLANNGVFIGTLPHFIWGSLLRKRINIKNSKTKFKLFTSMDDENIELDSLLMDDDELKTLLYGARLDIIEFADLYLPTSVLNISTHIQIPAEALGVSPYKIPIVKMIIARRKDE